MVEGKLVESNQELQKVQPMSNKEQNVRWTVAGVVGVVIVALVFTAIYLITQIVG